jgi:hypothetical protein
MVEEEICCHCGDLKDELGNCYTCSSEHVDLRKDFLWEYAHESKTERGSQFRTILPYYEDFGE